jgi:hypothetical protein
LEEDDVIEVIEDVEDGWARGRLKDRVGLFPTNFVSFTVTPTTNTSKFLQARAIAEEIESNRTNLASYSTLSRVSEEPRKKLKDETNGKTPVDRTSSSGSSNILPSSFKASVRKNGGGAAANNNGPATQNPVNKQPPKGSFYSFVFAHNCLQQIES